MLSGSTPWRNSGGNGAGEGGVRGHAQQLYQFLGSVQIPSLHTNRGFRELPGKDLRRCRQARVTGMLLRNGSGGDGFSAGQRSV